MRETNASFGYPLLTAPAEEGSPDQASGAARSHHRPSVTLTDIRLRAYALWRLAGMPDGDCTRFWLEAEQDLLRDR